MVKFDSVVKGLKVAEKNILDNKAKAFLAISIQFAKDNKEQRRVPFKTGALGDSALLTPRNLLEQGMVVWSTPYASTVYEKNETGVAHWDIETWDANVSLYEQQAKVIWQKNIF